MSPRERPRAAPSAHVPALDGLRGLAILMVLFVHFVGDETPHDAIERTLVKLSNYGIWGVDLFFVLSGFLITGILHDAKNSPHYFRNFYVRRTLRIFPLYFGILLLLFVVLRALPIPYPAGLAESAHHQGWLWTYGCNIYLARAGSWALPYVSHFWSLAVEEHFYLVWPFVVLHFSPRALLRITFAIAVFALCLRVALAFAGVNEVALVVLTPCRLDALAIGALLAIAVRVYGQKRVARLGKRALPSLAGLVLLASVWHAATLGLLSSVVLPLRGTLVALSFGALLIACVQASRTSSLGRLFRGKALSVLGKYSYGLYVFHGIIAYLFQQRGTVDALSARIGSHLAAMLLHAAFGMALSLLVAVLSYELFEKQFLRLKDRFAPGAPSRPREHVAGLGRLGILALALLSAGCRDADAQPLSATPRPDPARSAARSLIAPNPLVSRNKRVAGWSPLRFAGEKNVNDGDARTVWGAGKPTPERPSWVAIDVGRGPTRVLFTWSAAGSFNYEETDYGSPGAYRIETSPDSTDGADGSWKVVASEARVVTHGAEQAFDFTGQRWVKLVVTAAPAESPNGVQIDEIGVHDVSAGASDTWFFMGDSITAFAFGRPPTPDCAFATQVHRRHPHHFPAVLNGGIGGTKSDNGAAHVAEWLARHPEARFWAIGYGTNDAAGDASDTTRFRANLTTIIERVRAAGRVPILARIPFAADGKHRNLARFNEVIDALQRAYGLVPGPDLHAWFSAHPDELRDGLHPDDKGIASINRLWAEAVDALYAP